METLRKIRNSKQEEVDVVDLADQEAFIRWIGQPYHERFVKQLEHMALTEGIGLTDSASLLKSLGKREALLEIIDALRRKERAVRDRMSDEDED
jgi:hypothetical protein